jgi:adenylate cyclase class 2
MFTETTPMVETEVKFLLGDLPSLASRLESLGAELVIPETHEYNLKFDRPDRSLATSFQVLRLRRDRRIRLTYKAPGKIIDGVNSRREIEFEADDFDSARAFLEALGYEVSFIYEKYRATYEIDQVEVVLDRTPIGDFAELEGPNGTTIAALAGKLGLDWEKRTTGSYPLLFQVARDRLGLDARDMTFAAFEGAAADPAALGLAFADK